jgi:hypothetical protein
VEDNKTRIQEENYEVLGTKETRRQQENPENVAQWKTRILEQDMDEPQGSPVNEFGENRKSEYLTCRYEYIDTQSNMLIFVQLLFFSLMVNATSQEFYCTFFPCAEHR